MVKEALNIEKMFSENDYNGYATADGFILERGNKSILILATHSVRSMVDGVITEPERFTGAIAILLARLSDSSSITKITFGEDIDLIGILDSINAQCISEYGEDFSPFSISDLEYLTINISYSNTIGELLRNNPDILNHIGKDMFNTEITNGTSKDEIKNVINVCSKLEQDQPTVAIIVNNQSIQFK